ncbi:hypothetical protein MUK42_36883 [Musa troglodytarum]|uniref:Uncharacterized protein n=1 Tax=Musa troglodytarum TaxID=320322 RepID=A0A9E7EA42_9LILI|nr:hypothetical protein MUK42_36883 [Musa troglodytarum]
MVDKYFPKPLQPRLSPTNYRTSKKKNMETSQDLKEMEHKQRSTTIPGLEVIGWDGMGWDRWLTWRPCEG